MPTDSHFGSKPLRTRPTALARHWPALAGSLFGLGLFSALAFVVWLF
jgi:hypothetical protein